MRRLSIWMKAVGVLYIAMGVMQGVMFLVPAAGEATVGARVPDAELSGPMFEFALDTWLMFGLGLLVVGTALLWASRDPWTHRVLGGTVIALEAVRGLLDDLIWLARGYPAAPYVAWIVLHAVVIATGLWALRAATGDATPDPRSASTGRPAHQGRL